MPLLESLQQIAQMYCQISKEPINVLSVPGLMPNSEPIATRTQILSEGNPSESGINWDQIDSLHDPSVLLQKDQRDYFQGAMEKISMVNSLVGITGETQARSFAVGVLASIEDLARKYLVPMGTEGQERNL
jgi:hypothetical protein